MSPSQEQEVIEALGSNGSNEALGEGVRSRSPDRGRDDPDVLGSEDLVEGTGEPGVSVSDQEPRVPAVHRRGRESRAPAASQVPERTHIYLKGVVTCHVVGNPAGIEMRSPSLRTTSGPSENSIRTLPSSTMAVSRWSGAQGVGSRARLIRVN